MKNRFFKKVSKVIIGIGAFVIGMVFVGTKTPLADTAGDEINKKGIQMVNGESADVAKDLGVGHALWNIRVMDDEATVAGNMHLLNKNKSYGIENTVVLLNPWQEKNKAILPVASPVSGAHFYGYNVESAEAVEALKKEASRVAKTYKNVVTNWIIGNEVNDSRVWNYMPGTDVESYTRAYATAFRIWYDAIKAENPDANVLIPFDYRWKWYTDQGKAFQARDMLEILNPILKDTEYGIAWHAYPQELLDPDFTDDADVKSGFNTPLINMKNISVLTDYMQQDEYLTPGGEVRTIILSEQGFMGTSEEEQAKYIQMAYEIARDNPFIDAFILSRERDVAGEIHAGVQVTFGLKDLNNNKRKSYDVYKGLK